ncbi:TRIM2_3 [Mytilus coruscus]|uniref:TRIM2_3 n=1 Tax=Mytilus coruscus TaxID=42192 RepID=A0A6J8ERN2_MYTCO|nr:TRIM2_3 [Mytilus coruscus]
MKSSCYGIVHVDETLIFCGNVPNGIYKIDLNSNQTSVISCTILSATKSYIAYFNSKFYVTNDREHTITCFDNQGSVIWTYEDRINIVTPQGVSIDSNGNVFVACFHSNNVSVISPDGSRAKQVLDHKDGLHNPSALHYERTTNRLLIANNNGTVCLFKAQ